MHRYLLLVLAGLVLSTATAQAQSDPRIEVIEARGVIDGSVERALTATIDQAEKDEAELVVIQLDSRGVIDQDRASRLIDRIREATVPVSAWIPPAGEAENMAAILVMTADFSGIAPTATIGPIETADLRSEEGRGAVDALKRFASGREDARDFPFDRRMDAETAVDEDIVNVQAATVTDLLEEIDGERFEIGDERVRVSADPEESSIRLRKLDLFGRLMHAAAQPSIAYLLLLLGLVGIVFELFHPSTGPAGVSGLAALALAGYGIHTLGGSWFGVALIIAGVAAFCVDLRYATLGAFSIGGLVALISGSLLLFRSPWLRVSPWVLAFGIVSMVMFLVGAMTRVLRDLRAVARGELEVTDAHPHHDGHGGHDDA